MKITLSGKPGSGKSTVAKLVAKRLRLRHYSTGDFMRGLAVEKNMSIIELNNLAEKDKSIDKILDQRQIKLGKKQDNFIIDGRLGWHFIPDSIKLFLDASADTNAKRIFNDLSRDEKENTGLKETKKGVVKRMNSERLRYKKAYNIDCYTLNNYDFVIDRNRLTIKEVVERVISIVKSAKSSKNPGKKSAVMN